MNTLLIEPTDVLFFRDAVPMSAGQGKGAGCRMPFPSTLHEAFRASLLRARGETSVKKEIPGRPRKAPKRGNWHDREWPEEDQRKIATRDFRSLRTIGPLPLLEPDRDGKPLIWEEERHGQKTGVRVSYSGLLLPVPLDVAFSPDRQQLARLQLWLDRQTLSSGPTTDPLAFRPPCLPVATTPPDKHGQPHGWWTVGQFTDYLRDEAGNTRERFRPLPTADLWSAEHRVGVQIDPGSFASAAGQLYAGTYLRADRRTRFVAWYNVGDPAKARNGEVSVRQRERQQLAALDWLLLGGECRLARLWHKTEDGQDFTDPLSELRNPPSPPPGEGPCLLKWVLVTPAIFAHGSLPGWCCNVADGKPAGEVRLGASRRKPGHEPLPGRARLISWCIGKPRTVSGWDMLANDGRGSAKPTMLAVPEGSVYYFLCENRATAAVLARKLHWQPRSDFYGEKGCGYGLVSFALPMHPSSDNLSALAQEVFV